MSFRDTLLQIGANKLLPDRILSTLISIQQQNQLDEAVGLILTEILYPGSQQLSGNPSNAITSLTPLNIPEATARGAQMGQILQQLPTQPNWQNVLLRVLSNFTATSNITNASLSQFLSSLKSDERIDQFLSLVSKSGDSRLLKTILIQLNTLEPSQGAIDIFELKLAPILEIESNTRHLLLYFKSIVQLEVKTVALLQNEGPVPIDQTVNQIFIRDYRAAPEYITLACLYILHETPQARENDVVVNVMQTFIVSLLDNNSPYLSAIFNKFEEFDAPGLGKLLVQYYESRKSTDSLHRISSLTASFKDDTVIMSILRNAIDFPEAFSIAVTFSQYGWKNFQVFVSNQLNQNIAIVARTIIDYLENQASIEYENAQQGRRQIKSLNLETVYFLMTTLGSKQFPNELFDRFKNLQALCLQAYPRLINFGQGHDSAILMNSATNTFSVDVEKEMKVYYQKMYNKEIEIKDIIHMLQRLKVSDNPHDQDVFACMIHSLLDEYRFFPEYPVDALATTSVLFGNTIFFRLVEGPALSIGLRYILESARQSPQSKMFKFAIQALYSFTKRLPEFPKFCAMLSDIPALQSQPQLYETCKAIVSGNILPSEAQAPPAPDQAAKSGDEKEDAFTSKFVSLNPLASINGDVAQESPKNDVSDRVLFMVNNITEGNLQSRAEEMKELLGPKYFKWLAQYLVSQRAKVEPNNQTLYAELVQKLGSTVFDSYVIQVTLQQIIMLLNKAHAGGDDVEAEDVLSNSERSQLKNLGSWLGRITLPRNLPIQRRFVSLKSLLVEGYDHNKLSIVIPFVCKILDQTKNSMVFKYPNPWLLGILQVLKELYDVADLKLALKFELEVLCNSLKVDINEIESSDVIRSHKKGELEQFVDSQKVLINLAKLSLDEKRGISPVIPPASAVASALDSNNAPTAAGVSLVPPQQNAQQQLNALHQLQQQQQRLLAAQAAQRQFDGQNVYESPAISSNAPLAQQAASVAAAAAVQQQQQQQQAQQGVGSAFDNLNGNSIFVTHPNLKRLFQLALTKAVREILPPVVNRTNSVALITTKSLILKDFALEVDDMKLRRVYINTVRQLSESLTLASCRDLLRESVQLNLHQYIQSLGQQLDASILEQLPTAIIDNLHLACAIIQKAATEKSVQDLDELMLPAIALRRQFKDSRPDQAFCDTQYASRYAMSLPEPLGIKPGGVTAKQLTVYEEFGKNKGALGLNNQLGSIPGIEGAVAGGVPTPTAVAASIAPQVQQQIQQEQQRSRVDQLQQQQPTVIGTQPGQLLEERTLEQTLIMLQQLTDSLLKAINDAPDKEIKLRDTDSVGNIRLYVAEIIQLLGKVNINEIYMKFAQLTMNALFASQDPSTLLIESLVFLLDKVCEMSLLVAKFVSAWLVGADDERKLNVKILTCLTSIGLLALNDLDMVLSKAILDKKDVQTGIFSCEFILSSLFSEKPIALISDFVNTIGALKATEVSEIKEDAKYTDLLEKIDKSKDSSYGNLENLALDTSNLKDYFAYVFAEWVKLGKFSDDNDDLQITFINQLFDTGLISKPEYLVSFITTAVEMSVLSFNKEGDVYKRTPVDTYTSIDSLAKLIIKLLLVQEDASSDNQARCHFFKSLLSVVLLSFAHDHETSKANFNERPYFRFFSTLFSEWAAIDQKDYRDVTTDDTEIAKLKKFNVEFYYILSDHLLTLQPAAFPGFTFAWICLISHRMFLPKVLELADEKVTAWGKFSSLILVLLRFQSGYIKGKTVPEALSVVYKGTLRIFLVLLHDFPEFLSEYANPLVSAMSPSFVQLRNIVLSAAPKDMQIPDPFQPGLKVDRLVEISNSPAIAVRPQQMLAENGIRKATENYLRIPSTSLLKQIMAALDAKETAEIGIGFKQVHYNIKLINSLALYTGISATEDRPRESRPFNSKSSQVSLLVSIMQEGSVELQYLLLQAITNNLRFPNAHTHWFSCVILHFFGSNHLWGDNRINVQQLITRVLLERMICNKPHPWGLMITFTELMKNSDYSFFDLPFTKEAPEFERLFNSLFKHVKNVPNTSNTAVAAN